jgi:hypothetical protein
VRALKLKEERKMPEVGYSFDRRTFSIFVSYGGEEQVHSLVCFICAQIYTDTTGSSSALSPPFAFTEEDIWKGYWYPSPCQQISEIQYYSVGQTLLPWREHDEKHEKNSFARHLSLEQYTERYCDVDCTWKSVPDADWRRTLRFPRDRKGATSEVLLCCPGDVAPCERHVGSTDICGDCRIPLCTRCFEQLQFYPAAAGWTPEIPMALGHDNFWGYTTDLVVRYKVRWIEIAAVLPMWTHMIAYYVEGQRATS